MAKQRNSKKIPTRVRPASIASQIYALKEGECCSRIIDIDDSVTVREIRENMTLWRKRAVANTQSSIQHAKKRLGKEGIGRVFSIETSCYLSSSYSMSIIVIIRRESDYVEL